MTTSPDSTPVPVRDMDDAAAQLRARGHRVSAPRRLVLTALLAADRPLTAEEIAGGAGGLVAPSDITSVYRNLETLEEVGIVSHVHLGHGPGRYRLAGDEPRDYIVCERCGRVDVADPEAMDAVRAVVAERLGYQARFAHFPIVGVCPGCALAFDSVRERSTVMPEEHSHEHPHSHEHSHGDVKHSHPHAHHEHEHVEHEHEHRHGDVTHSHPHVHEEGLEEEHTHEHS
jgi:Fur family ferric uptake transcriptional regulator